MRTGKQRQREETAAETGETGVEGGTGPGIIISKWQVIWGNNRNSSVRRQDAAKWSASAKWENDASLLSTVTQNVPSQSKKKANEILARIYDAQFPKKREETKSKKSNKFIL